MSTNHHHEALTKEKLTMAILLAKRCAHAETDYGPVTQRNTNIRGGVARDPTRDIQLQ